MTLVPEVVDARTVVLVEGVSDQLAVEALALRHGRDLAADGVAVLAMGGATNIGHFLRTYGPHRANVALAGLCDEAEAGISAGLATRRVSAHQSGACRSDWHRGAKRP